MLAEPDIAEAVDPGLHRVARQVRRRRLGQQQCGRGLDATQQGVDLRFPPAGSDWQGSGASRCARASHRRLRSDRVRRSGAPDRPAGRWPCCVPAPPARCCGTRAAVACWRRAGRSASRNRSSVREPSSPSGPRPSISDSRAIRAGAGGSDQRGHAGAERMAEQRQRGSSRHGQRVQHGAHVIEIAVVAPRGRCPEWPCPGSSSAITWKRSASSGASRAKLAALSSQPCRASSGGGRGRPRSARPGCRCAQWRCVAQPAAVTQRSGAAIGVDWRAGVRRRHRSPARIPASPGCAAAPARRGIRPGRGCR